MQWIVSVQSDQNNKIVNVLNVEMAENDPQTESVTQDQDLVPHAGLNVETSQLKACQVCVTPLENILFDDAKSDPSVPINDLPTGEHYTRSHTRKPNIRTSHMPHKASAGKQYEEQDDFPLPKKRDQSLSNPK